MGSAIPLCAGLLAGLLADLLLYRPTHLGCILPNVRMIKWTVQHAESDTQLLPFVCLRTVSLAVGDARPSAGSYASLLRGLTAQRLNLSRFSFSAKLINDEILEALEEFLREQIALQEVNLPAFSATIAVAETLSKLPALEKYGMAVRRHYAAPVE